MKPNSIGVDRHGLSEERSNKKAVLTFGRFNPPTSGHELLISKVVGEARSGEPTTSCSPVILKISERIRSTRKLKTNT